MLISIITINYNNKLGLNNTIESVIIQSFDGFEYIVIDGASTDGSSHLIESFRDKLSYWISEEDSGIYNAMNKGILASKGKYLLFLNSGDTLHDHNTLDLASEYLRSDKDIYYGNLELEHKAKKEIKTYPNELSFSFFYNKGHIPHPSSFIRRTLFEEVYLYKEKFKIVSDWDFFVCAICKFNASYMHIDKTISSYQTNGISSNPKYFDLLKKERHQSLLDNFPMFIQDIDQLINYDKKFKLNRFKILDALEKHTFAQKLNSIWLTFLARLFGELKK